MSCVTPIVLAIFVSSGILVQLTLSASMASNRYLFAAALTFFLATIQLPFLLTNFTISRFPILVRFINDVSFLIMIVSFTAIVPPFPMFNTIQSMGIGSAICWGLLCFVISMLYQSIGKAPRCYRRCLHVAFLTLSIGFAGLYIDPLSYLKGKFQYNSGNFQHHITGRPGTSLCFVLESTLVLAQPKNDAHNLIIGGSLTIYAALYNFAMACGFDVRGPVRSFA